MGKINTLVKRICGAVAFAAIMSAQAAGAAELGETRFTDFSDWVSDPASKWNYSAKNSTYTNWVKTVSDGSDQWIATWANVKSTFDSLHPAGFESPNVFLRSIQGAQLVSPVLAEGVGTIYFTSSTRKDNYTAAMDVQVTTNVDLDAANWVTVKSVTLYGNQYAEPVRVNRPDVRHVRFVRIDGEDPLAMNWAGNERYTESIAIDNVAISCPPAVLVASDIAVSPTTPDITTPVSISTALAPEDSAVPFSNPQATLKYKLSSASSWTETAAPISDSVATASIGELVAGEYDYFFTIAYEDGAYSRDPDGDGPQPLNNESLSPCVTATNSFTVNTQNTRILALSGDLDFGLVATNASKTLPLILTNNGNAALTVSSIALPDCFTADPAAFVVPPDGVVTSLVTFAPGQVATYDDTLIVQSDLTDGEDSVNIIAEGREAQVVAIDTFDGPTTGTRLENLAFSATATDNYGGTCEFRFDWGDNSTSEWATAASATHAWSDTGDFAIRAQARSHETGLESAWSQTISLSITNTFVMRLAGGVKDGALAFGDVQLTLVGTNKLEVCNDGTGPLSISAIELPQGFAADMTSFAVEPGASTNVTITFAPTALGLAEGTLNIVSDAISGVTSCTVSGTGIEREWVSVPDAPEGSEGGIRTRNINFSAISTNLYGHNVECRFDWGDGTTSGWARVTQQQHSRQHNWQEIGDFAVRAQARCETHNEVISDWSEAAYISITNVRLSSVSSGLAFGNVATNATKELVITIYNNGTEDLTISSIDCPEGFSVDESSFVIGYNAASPSNKVVKVTFSPSELKQYDGTVVIHSDAMNGDDSVSVSGKGIEAEMIFCPVVTGPEAGTRTKSLSYTASASNNWNRAMQYRFDWGDGEISGWTSGTRQQHAWQTEGDFSVRIQARSQQDPEVVSEWSEAVVVTITDTRVISIATPDLTDFMSVITNTTPTVTLSISNKGTGPLTVSDITFDPISVFSADPTEFVIPAGESYDVTLRFAPVEADNYETTLTVVSDKTSGGDTLAIVADATDREEITTPELTTDIGWYGTIGQAIRFSASAQTSFARVGHTLQYQYDWDDDGMGEWLANGTQYHDWSTFGIRTVRVQARCASDNAVVSEQTSVKVAILDDLDVSLGSALNGRPVSVSVTVPETNGVVTACAICVIPNGSTTDDVQQIPLVNNNGAWVGQIPSLGSGELEYFVVYSIDGVADGIVWPYDGTTCSSTISDDLGEIRFTDFSNWVRDDNSIWNYSGKNNTYTNWFRVVSAGNDRWIASGVNVGTSFGDNYLPNGCESTRLYMRSMQGAYLQSPKLSGGIGTIYFTSTMRTLGHIAVLEVQVSTEDAPEYDDWELVKTIQYSGESDAENQNALPICLNRRDIKYVRFVRTSLNMSDTNAQLTDGSILIDNVAISYPPSDVVIDQEYLPMPAYPSKDESVVVRCRVTDIDPAYPAINRRVTVWYRLKNEIGSIGGWQSAPMTEIDTDVYEGTIPAQDPGRIYYYYRCDFDGYHYFRDPDGTGPQGTTDEDMSPAYGYTEEDADGNIYYNYPVRHFLSDCESLRIECDDVREDLRTMKLVDDYTWQGIVSVSGVTNLLWTFQGVNGYTADAVEFEAENRVWAEDNQDFPYPPIAGLAERDGANNIQALLEYNGFLLLRINTATLDYIVKRAVYQDFNVWQADDSHFEESLGKFSVQTFQDDINAWDVDSYTADRYIKETFNNDGVMDSYASNPMTTDLKWTIDDAMVVGERRTNSNVVANHALKLSTDGGKVGNSGLSLTDGIKDFKFKARASIDDTNYLLYKKSAAFAWTLPMTITTKIRAAKISNAKASISVLACYQVGFGGSIGSFYEVRVTQEDDGNNGQNARWRLALYRWDDGVCTKDPLAQSDYKNGNITETAQDMVIDIVNENGTKFTVTYRGQQVLAYTDNSSSKLTGGSFGYMSFDACPVITSMKVAQGSTVLFKEVKSNFNSTLIANDWYWGGKRTDNGANRWTATSDSVTRAIPTQTLQAYIAPADGVTVADYEKFVPVDNPITINSLDYNSFTCTLKRWDKSFVQLRLVGGDVPVVVEDLEITPWRAVTRDAANEDRPTISGIDYTGWDSWDAQQYQWVRDVAGWAVLEGWVGTSSGSNGKEILFDRSRANTNIVQGLVSPVMTNGIGSIAFDYRTEGAPVHIVVERSNEGDPASYTVVDDVVLQAASATRYSCTIRETYNGRIRVRIVNDTARDAVLKIDNLVARDYPPRDESDWVAYNVMITDQQPTRLYEGKSCFLNNSTTRDIVGGELNEWAPYVQTPKVGTGIGEIGFWCRTWDVGGTGELELRVCKEVDDAEDTFLTNLVVTADNYEYIKLEPYDIENMVLRIYSSTNAGMSRVCIDEIVMTEPVRAGYEIFNVKLILDDEDSQQPLYTDKVGIEAKIGRFLMNPQDIKLYASYIVGTNVWGVANWRGYELDPARGCVTFEMEPTQEDPTVYRTKSNQRIPAQPIDQVVQYVVWGTYDGIEGRPVLMAQPSENDEEGRWTNPSWYYPVDLNAGKSAWSPYYFSYSCPPQGVWINELNYPVKISTEAGNEYVELIGHTGYDIGNWRIEVVAPYESMSELYRAATIPASTLLSEDELTEEEIEWGYADYYDVDNDGWSYFVWGDTGMWPEADLEDDDDTTYLLPQNGGIRLIRSNGAYEHSIAYGPGDLSKDLEEYGYKYIGYKFTLPPVESPLQLQGDGESVDKFYWYQPSSYTYTPGHINIDQSLSNVVVVVTTYNIYSVFSGLGGQTVLLDDTLVSFPAEGPLEVEKGQKVEFTYTAKPWCKIETLYSDGVPVVNAAGEHSWSVTFRDIAADHSNEVAFALNADCKTDGIDDAAMQSWLAGKYDSARAFDADDYGLYLEYALDTDPTVGNTLDVAITALAQDGDGKAVVDFTVLVDGETPVTSVQSPVMADELFIVESTASLLDIDWQPVGDGTLEYDSGASAWRWTSDEVLPANIFLRIRIPNP